MGLDVYVGPFSRYYTGDWKTVIQQYGEQSGVQVTVSRPRPPTPGLAQRILGLFGARKPAVDPVASVNQWMAGLSQYAPDGKPFLWSDALDGYYFTDKPAWDCYGAILLWAAHEEAQAGDLPPTAETWQDDPVYASACANPSSRYRHLLGGAEIWLPRDFDPPFEGPTPTGETVRFGSCVQLLSALNELNQRTWQASGTDLAAWREAGAEFAAPFETSARFGFAVMHFLTNKSVENRLPMKLDY